MTIFLPSTPVYGRPEFTDAIDLSQAEIPEHPIPPDSTYQLIMNELLLDGRVGLNLATFCNEAYTDPWGQRIVSDNIKKNFIDHEEYPGSNLAEKRSIWMMAREMGTTFDPHDKTPDEAQGLYGVATIGSSEAVMLGLIAHKYRWNENNRANLEAGRADPRDRPVVLMSAHVHGCWDKFCKYYGAVALYVPVDEPPYCINGDIIYDILKTRIEDQESAYAKTIRESLVYLNDQGNRTIGELVMCVGAVIGTTFTGAIDDVPSIDGAVDNYCNQSPSELHIDIPIHVDAASSGFVLMFSHNGNEVVFRFSDTKRVRSINISNHKFGMTFPGMGSVVFRDKSVVDPSLVYTINYLGGSFTDYTVNFSRGSSMIVMQYYNFLRFGRSGYRDVMNNCLQNTKSFLAGLDESEVLRSTLMNISDYLHLPIIVLTWAEGMPRPSWDLTDLSDELRQSSWIVPSYVLPKTSPGQIINPQDGTQVLRIVVQQVVSNDKLSKLLIDMENAVNNLSDYTAASRGRRRAVTGYKC
jgi:glutamate decarboxylase